jgi:hypothetical protein
MALILKHGRNTNIPTNYRKTMNTVTWYGAKSRKLLKLKNYHNVKE